VQRRSGIYFFSIAIEQKNAFSSAIKRRIAAKKSKVYRYKSATIEC
jgi:hypothetical protein